MDGYRVERIFQHRTKSTLLKLMKGGKCIYYEEFEGFLGESPYSVGYMVWRKECFWEEVIHGKES